MTYTNLIMLNADEIFVKTAGNNQNPAIVFIHGASLSSDFWDEQFADKSLTENFSLYAFDLPGHGRSYRSGDADDYTLKGLGKVVNEVINSLDIKEYIIVTLSIGSNIVAETLKKLKGCKGLFMAGACLIGEKFPVSCLVQSFPYMYLLSASEGTDDELEDYAKYDMYQPQAEVIKNFITAYRHTDPVFRNTIGKVLAENDYSDEVMQVKNAGMPLALVYGKEEAIVKPLYLESAGLQLWGSTIHLVEHAGHLVNCDNADEFNHLLLSFANHCLMLNNAVS